MNYLYYLEKNSFQITKDHKSKRILIINSAHDIIGGAELYSIDMYKNLVKNGNYVIFLVLKDSNLEKKLIESKIDYYAYNKLRILNNTIQPGLESAIRKICIDDKIDIINCNIHREAVKARKAVKILKTKIVLTRHIPQELDLKYIKDCDGIITVSPYIKEDLDKKIDLNKLKTKTICIPPFFDYEKYLNYKPIYKDKYNFFKNFFGIEIKQNIPLICMIANMQKNLDHKNHTLLLKAVEKLKKDKNIIVQVALAGNGPSIEFIKKEAEKLNLLDQIYFLGFTDQIAEIIYHSDIKVLTSKNEAFGIVLLEAALLKKPIIIATKTGAANYLIIDNQTGLLFENDNIESLASKIEDIINNPEKAKKLGQNAYDLVIKNFNTQESINKLEKFYDFIINN